MAPVIGISGSVLLDPLFLPVIIKRSYVNEQYIEAITAGGGIPLIIPVTDEAAITAYVSLIDGLVLSGGHDVSPQMYGEETLRLAGESYPARDTFEQALLLEALKQHKPVLGICRGAQLLNVVHGGSLYQDVSYATHVQLQHLQATAGEQPVHNVTLTPESRIATIFDTEIVGVNSFHHQLIKTVAPNFEATGVTSDGVVEVIEAKTKDQFIMGVQWHPEQMAQHNEQMQGLFNTFVTESLARKTSTSVPLK